jgi:TetR/AcrR family transcriptional regulator
LITVWHRPKKDKCQSEDETILDTAEAAFAEHGFDGARIDAIARASGYNISLLFQYFGDKLGLYAEVLKRIDREITELQERVLAPMLEDETIAENVHTFKPFLETTVRALFDYLLEHPRFLRMLTWEMAAGWQTYVKIASQLHIEDIGQFETLPQQVQSAGLLRSGFSPLIQMTLILQICQVYLASLPLYQLLLPGEDVSSARMLARGRDYIIALIVQGIMVDPKDGEAGESRVNRPEMRNDDTK